MALQGRRKVKMWLVLVAVFVLGSVTGVALTGLYRSRAPGGDPSETREKAMHERFEKMRTEMKLTDEQTKTVQTINYETRKWYPALPTQPPPRFKEPRQKT